MNKAEMVEHIAQAAELSRSAAERAVDAMVAAVKLSLRKGDTVTLVGFGSFYVSQRAPRKGRNPKTGAEIRIAAAQVPRFRAGKALKDALN
jgi:DNA-binding protein HU-beta